MASFRINELTNHPINGFEDEDEHDKDERRRRWEDR